MAKNTAVAKSTEPVAPVAPITTTPIVPDVDVQKAADAERAKVLMTKHNNNKSAVIRELNAEWPGKQRGRIARAMGIKYQFVRNVLISTAKKPANPSNSAGETVESVDSANKAE